MLFRSLSIDKEFNFKPEEEKITAEDIVNDNESVSNEEESVSNGKDELNVYDIVLAGVVREKD